MSLTLRPTRLLRSTGNLEADIQVGVSTGYDLLWWYFICAVLFVSGGVTAWVPWVAQLATDITLALLRCRNGSFITIKPHAYHASVIIDD